MIRRPWHWLVLLALLAGLADASPDAQTSRFRLRRTLPPPGPLDPTPPPNPVVTDHGGYRPQMYPSHGGNAVGGCRVTPNGVPQIIKINSLADTNTISGTTGSGTTTDPFVRTATLRGALTNGTYPRCIVFEVGGYITINGTINVVGNPYITIAGQTAPEPGIWIRASAHNLPSNGPERAIYVATNNVVIQHIRIGMGNTSCNSAIQFYNFDNGANIVSDNIIDHVSLRWNQDEGFFFSYNAGNTLIWRSVIAETLVSLPGTQGVFYQCPGGGRSDGHGLAIGWGDGFSILQNVIAHNVERNPQADGGFSGAIQNNVYYAPGLATWLMTFRAEAFQVRWDGNYIKRDSQGASSLTGVRVTDAVSGSQLYLNDNIYEPGPVSPAYTQYVQNGSIDPRVSTIPSGTTVSGYTPMTATATYEYVLARAGARPLTRDAADTRIINDVRNRTGSVVLENSSVIVFPALTATSRAYTIPANPFTTAAGQTFRSNMEMDLENCATGTTCGGNTVTPLEPAE